MGSARSTLMRGVLGAPFLPRYFYDDFPSPGREWVSTLGPHNGHLLADVAAMYLALGVPLALAAVSLGGEILRASLVTWLVFAVPHPVYHAATLHHYELLIDRVGETSRASGSSSCCPSCCSSSAVLAGRQAGGARGG